MNLALSLAQQKYVTCLSKYTQKWVLLHVGRHCKVAEFPWVNNQGKKKHLHFTDISNMLTFNNITSLHSLFKALLSVLRGKKLEAKY